MRMFWSKPPRQPTRRPAHDDATVEMQLRQIESHYRIIAGQEIRIDTYQAEITQHLDAARKLRLSAAGESYNSGNYLAKDEQAKQLVALVSALEAQIRQLEDAIAGQHEVIAHLRTGIDNEALKLLFGNDV